MDLDFSKEKRAELQKQAYGKLYAYCNKCYLPLIPTSKVTMKEHKEAKRVRRPVRSRSAECFVGV